MTSATHVLRQKRDTVFRSSNRGCESAKHFLFGLQSLDALFQETAFNFYSLANLLIQVKSFVFKYCWYQLTMKYFVVITSSRVLLVLYFEHELLQFSYYYQRINKEFLSEIFQERERKRHSQIHVRQKKSILFTSCPPSCALFVTTLPLQVRT